MRRHIIYLLQSAIISLFVLFLSGCASKPNISILDEDYEPAKANEKSPNFLRTKGLLFGISKKNTLLAKELGKLPEMHNEIAPEKVSALEQIVDLYNADPAVFNNAFEQMYKVGKPDVRRYCSPLQALFWLIEDGRINEPTSWKSEHIAVKILKEKKEWREREAGKLYDSCLDNELKRKIDKVKEESPNMAWFYIIELAKEHPEAFTYKFSQDSFKEFQEKKRLKEDDQISLARYILENYSLERLLDLAWIFENTENEYIARWGWLEKEAKKLENSCLDNEIKKKIAKLKGENPSATEYTIDLAKKYPNAFGYKLSEDNFKEVQSRHKKRWRGFNTVVDRLNAPELVHNYVKFNFTYIRGPINGYWEEAYATFQRKNGHCIAYANFGEYCLKKAGYKTFVRSVDFPGQPCCSDHTASGIILDDGSYLLVVDSGGYSITKHNNVESLDLQIAHGSQIVGRMWGHKR